MANVSINRKHTKSTDEIKSIIKQMQGKIKDEYGISSTWENDTSLSLSGSKINGGSVEFSDKDININIKLGFLASAFSGTIKDKINDMLDDLLK